MTVRSESEDRFIWKDKNEFYPITDANGKEISIEELRHRQKMIEAEAEKIRAQKKS